MSKFYAVSIGKTNDIIYSNWPDCQKNVSGVKYSRYKSFPSKTEAQNWLDSFKNTSTREIIKEKEKIIDDVVAYCDGSYMGSEIDQKKGGYGIVICKEDRVLYQASGNVLDFLKLHNLPLKQSNNVSELVAIMATYCLSGLFGVTLIKSDSKICVQTFNEWIYNWIQKDILKTKENPELIEFIWNNIKDTDIKLEHVYGHSNDMLNDLADKLADKGRLL